MGNFNGKSNRYLMMLSIGTLLFLSACSDDKPVSSEATKKAESTSVVSVADNKKVTTDSSSDKQNYEQMSKPLDKANWVEKGKFRNEFARDCVARELASEDAEKLDRAYIEKTCDCIANYMDDNLTDQEAEEFLGEDNHMRALQIRYDAAAFHCIQEHEKVQKGKVTKFK